MPYKDRQMILEEETEVLRAAIIRALRCLGNDERHCGTDPICSPKYPPEQRCFVCHLNCALEETNG